MPSCPAVGKESYDIQGEAVFIVFKVLVKMWIISEDKVRLLFMLGFERGTETEKEIEYLLAAAA